MAEQTPQAPEQQQKAAENPTATSTQSVKQILEELFAQNTTLTSLKKEFEENQTIKDETEKKRVRKIRDNLQVVIGRIRHPASAADEIKLPPVVTKIIKDMVLDDRKGKEDHKGIDQSEINNETAPVVYELLRISMPDSGFDFTTPVGMTAVLNKITEIAPFEPHMATKILKKLIIEAKEKGCTDEDVKIADMFAEPYKYKKNENQLEDLQKQRKRVYEETFAPILGITLGQRAQDQIQNKLALKYREALASGNKTQDDFQREVNEAIEAETDRMRSEISMALNDVIGTTGTQKETIGKIKYNGILMRMQSEGKITEADYQALSALPENKAFAEYVASQYKKNEGDDLVHEAMRIFVPTEHQVKVLRAISSASALKDFLQNETDEKGKHIYLLGGQSNAKTKDMVNWDEFQKDIKEIFGELLGIAGRSPKQFFEQAFNPMYEGHFYQVLLQRINHLGAQVTSASENGDEWFEKQRITIKDERSLPSPKTEEAPYKMLTYINESKIGIGVAIGDFLTNHINEYKSQREHLHNFNSICSQGLGWEQLKNYGERIDLTSLDRLMRQEEDLSLASNLYGAALQQEMSSKGRVVTPDLGRTDQIYQLNSAERIAFFQLKAELQAKPKNKGVSETIIDRQAIQKIRMASAIAYGVTGEFWNVLITARMPHLAEKAINSLGETVSKGAPSFVGTNHRGYEKMIGELDLDMVLERFNIPKLYNDFRYMHRFRDMHHPPDSWSEKGWFNHADARRNKSLIEDALVNGRTDELADLDEFRVYLTDFLRTKCVGMFARGGWRFSNYDTLKEFKDGNVHEKVDYVKTLANIRKMGSYMTKRFIDDLKPTDFEGMSREEIKAILGIDKTWGQFTSAEKDRFSVLKLKKTLYETLLFDQMANVIPTKYLQLQERRWTPAGEKMMKEDLCDYLSGTVGAKYNYPKGILSLNVYDMYVSALTLAEKSTWRDKKQDDQNYKFDTLHLENNREKLEYFFNSYKQDLGVINESGRNIQIHEDFETFFETLKGFQKQLRKSIDSTRTSRENHTGSVETLQKRFAEMLATKGGDSKGNIENLIGGDDFDSENFLFGAAGGFAHVRFTGETHKCAAEMNPALGKLFFEVLPEFTKSQFKDIHDVGKFMKDKMLPEFKKIHGAIANMDKDQADEYCISLALFVSNLIGNDRAARIKIFGPMLEWFQKERYGTQSSTYKDFYTSTMAHPSHGADSDEIFEMFHVLFQGLNIPPSGKEVDHQEPVLKIFGRTIMSKTIYKPGEIPWNQEVGEHAAGLLGKTKWLETIIPVAGATFVLLLIAMAYLASQKNKKK